MELKLSPTVRLLLTAAAAAAAYVVAVDPFGELPGWVEGVLSTLLVVAGSLGLIPAQRGGTQRGVINPKLDERGEGMVGVLVAVALLLIVFILVITLARML